MVKFIQMKTNNIDFIRSKRLFSNKISIKI